MPPALALPRGRPTAMGDRAQLLAGNLFGHGWTSEDMLRRLLHDVIRVFEGTPAGDRPVEQPTRLHTALNLKTAKALGLTLPQSLLLRADEVIE